MNLFKNLVKIFVGACFVLSITAILVNICANPYGYYGDKQLGESGLTNARKIKLTYIKI
jgi:hypothetical protein